MALRWASQTYKDILHNDIVLDWRTYANFRQNDYPPINTQDASRTNVQIFRNICQNDNKPGLRTIFYGNASDKTTGPEDLTGTGGWTASNASVTRYTDYFIDSSYMHLLTKTGAAGVDGFIYQPYACTVANEFYTCLFRRGAAGIVSSVEIYDQTAGATRAFTQIDWSTDIVSNTSGTLLFAEWIDDNTVRVYGYATACVPGNTNRLRIRPAAVGSAANVYAYATAAIVKINKPTIYKSLNVTYNTSYLVDWASTGTIRVNFRLWDVAASVDYATDRGILGWSNGVNYFNLVFDKGTSTIRAEFFVGGVVRTSPGFAINAANINNWYEAVFTWDMTTCQLWINKTSVGTGWSGAVSSIGMPLLDIGTCFDGSMRGFVGEIGQVEYYSGHYASSTDIENDFKGYLGTSIFWDMNGHANGHERCNISRYVLNINTTHGLTNDAGQYKAGRAGITLNNIEGEFCDDQYAAFNPSNGNFNGLVTEKFLRQKFYIEAEIVDINTTGISERETIFIGRCSDRPQRSTDAVGRSLVNLDLIDAVEEMGEKTPLRARQVSGYYLSGETRTGISDNLIYYLVRYGTCGSVINFLGNPTMYTAVLTGSYAIAGGTMARFATGGLLAGYMAINRTGATATLTQTVNFQYYNFTTLSTVERSVLTSGNRYNFSVFYRVPAGIITTLTLTITELLVAGVVTSTTYTINNATGNYWQRADVTHQILNSTSDRLRVEVAIAGGAADIELSCLALTQSSDDLPAYGYNQADGTAGVISGRLAAEYEYQKVGILQNGVSYTRPYVVITEETTPWDLVKKIADAVVTRKCGIDNSGCFEFVPSISERLDPDYDLIDCVTSVSTDEDDMHINALTVKGATITQDTADKLVWQTSNNDDFPKGSNGYIALVTPGSYFPEPNIYGDYWARYIDL